MHCFIFGNRADLATGKKKVDWKMVMEHQSQNVPVEGLCLPRRCSSFFFRLLPKIWFSTEIRRHCSHRNQQKLHRITFEFSFNWGSDQNRVVSEYSPKFPTMQTNGTRSVRLTKSCSFPHVVKCVRSASLPSRNKLPFSFFFPKSAFSCSPSQFFFFPSAATL